jgi:hypothetical protein
MRGTLASLIVVILILIAAAFKMFFGSNRFAGSETISTSRSDGISVYELHLNHPDKESLPTQETPSP